jgi:hypothetical protein
MPEKSHLKRNKADAVAAALLNFCVWGAGYLYDRRYNLGILWIAAFVPMNIPFFFNLTAFLSTSSGLLILLGHLVVSIILAIDGYLGKGRKHL